MTQNLFIDKETKSKHFFKIFDLDNNELSSNIAEAKNEISEWLGQRYQPDLVVNVCVDDDFILPSQVLRKFKKSLARIVSSSAFCLVLTNGCGQHAKIIGEEIATSFKMFDMHEKEKTIKLLGVSKWNGLIAKDSKNDNLSIYDNMDHGDSDRLDKNHSHFILVKKNNESNDDSTANLKDWSTKEFKNDITNSLNEEFLSLSIILNGKTEALKTIIFSLNNNIPVLLIRETNGAADLVSNIIDEFNKLSFDEKLLVGLQQDEQAQEKFLRKFTEEIEQEQIDSNDLKTIIHLYHKLRKEEKTILINSLSFESNQEFESTILETLSLANNDKSEQQDRSSYILYLAIKWNNSLVVKHVLNYIHINRFSLPEFLAYSLLEIALVENRSALFEILMNEFHYKSDFMSGFLSSQRLYYLYNHQNLEEDAKLAPFAVIFRRKNEQFFSFEYIRNKINEILDIELKPNFFSLSSQVESFDASFDILDSLYSYQIKANENAEKCFEILENNPIIENWTMNLFIWATLFNRIEVVKMLLPNIENQIGVLLFVSILFEKFYQRNKSISFKDTSFKFETLAIEILDIFDRKETDAFNHRLLEREIAYFGRNILQLALTGKRQRFITTFAVQKCLINYWHNGFFPSHECKILEKPHKLKTLVSHLSIGLLAPFILYDDKKIVYNYEQFNVICEPNKESNEPEERTELIVKKHLNKPSFLFKYKNFMSSPQSKFFYETAFYILFLFIFSYFLLCELKHQEIELVLKESNSTNFTNTFIQKVPMFSPVEIIMNIWVTTFFIQIIFEIILWKALNYWNRYILIYFPASFIFYLASIFRFISYIDQSNQAFTTARILYCIDLMIWFMRLLFSLNVFANLGPKIVMLQKMIKDVISFGVIALIFLLAYGITAHAILYPGSSIDAAFFGVLIDICYWPLFGRIELLDLVDHKEFSAEAKTYGYIVTAIYMFIANILLINMLIAMLSNTFNNVEQNANVIWKFQNFKLIFTYSMKFNWEIKLFPTPPPLNLINFPLYVTNWKNKEDAAKKIRNQMDDEENAILNQKVKSYSEIILKRTT